MALGLHGLVLTLDNKAHSPRSAPPEESWLDAPSLDWVETDEEASDEQTAEPLPLANSPAETLQDPSLSASRSSSQDPAVSFDTKAGSAVDSDAALILGPESSNAHDGLNSPSSKSAPSPKRLSLAQLGIGTGPRFELTPAPAPTTRKSKQPTPEERLQQSIAQSAAHESQKLGLGITGEVKGALLRATQTAGMNSTGSALFVFTFGEGGVLKSATHNTLGGAGADWARVSSLVQATLQKKPAELPAGTKGARLSYAVDYSFVLPSGSKGGEGLDWSLTQSFDVADIGATKQAIAKVTLQNYQVF